jgi:hypothetical protein
MAMLNNQRVYAFAMKIANKHKKLSSNKGVCERRVDFRPPIFFARVKVMDAKKPLGYSWNARDFSIIFPHQRAQLGYTQYPVMAGPERRPVRYLGTRKGLPGHKKMRSSAISLEGGDYCSWEVYQWTDHNQ